MKRLLLGLIWFYQKAISPWFPARGSLLAAKRLAKCQPFHRQKCIEYDPVP